jgi:hypothetical protein
MRHEKKRVEGTERLIRQIAIAAVYICTQQWSRMKA